jgi:1,2-diacylglycerol 3-beta-galactosyltransferase
MHHGGSTVSQETSGVFDLVSQLGLFALNTRLQNSASDGCSSLLSNFLYYDPVGGSIGARKRNVRASLSLGGRGASGIRRILNDFNRVVKFHCERIPIGFASVRFGSGDNNGVREDGSVVLEDDGLALNGVEAEGPKKVLILMSDTGGGHRASAEAIKAAFHEEFGDDYQVSFDALCYV